MCMQSAPPPEKNTSTLRQGRLSPPPPLQLEFEKRTNDGTDAESPPSHLPKARSASVKMRCVCMRTISVPGHITI